MNVTGPDESPSALYPQAANGESGDNRDGTPICTLSPDRTLPSDRQKRQSSPELVRLASAQPVKIAAALTALTSTVPECNRVLMKGVINGSSSAKRSILHWARCLHVAAVRESRGHERKVSMEWIKTTAYDIYCRDTPSDCLKLESDEISLLQAHLEHLSIRGKSCGYIVAPQSDDDEKTELIRTPGQLSSDEHTAEFAYRFRPSSERRMGNDPLCRITLCFRSDQVHQICTLLSELVGKQSEFASLVTQAKIMGPSYLGTRTDCAIVYIKQDREKMLALVEHVYQRVGEENLLSHVPRGMMPVKRGISYAETHARDNTSFGVSRGDIVAWAVQLVLNVPSVRIEDAVNARLREFNYDLGNPALTSTLAP